MLLCGIVLEELGSIETCIGLYGEAAAEDALLDRGPLPNTGELGADLRCSRAVKLLL